MSDRSTADPSATDPLLTCDVVVVGSGASGLTAALTASSLGLEVVVVEKDAQFGGTSAWSGGWMWIPRNPLACEAGINEPLETPLTYLRHELGAQFNEPMARQFLEQGPAMVRFLRDDVGLKFVDGNRIPDFHDQTPAAGQGGRSLCAAPFDGRALGRRLQDLKEPLEEVSPFGMGIASGLDLKNFLDTFHKPKAFWHVTKRVLRHWWDVVVHGRGLHLVNGNALVAQLLKALDERGVHLLASAKVEALLTEQGRVCGVRTVRGVIAARRGVILAAGGFPHDQHRKADLFAHDPTGQAHHSAAPLSNTGDGLRLGEQVGGQVSRSLAHAGAWAPVSLVPKADGSTGRFPHLVERAKPGLIMVLRNGQRFTNEANAYHDVMQALFAATPPDTPYEAFMICDHRFQRRYGLGRARPRPFPVRPWIRNGYLKRADTVADLARACGLDVQGLEHTLATYNHHAAQGQDPVFHRGESAYNRIQGEADQTPNPCVAPIVEAPFYAIKIVPGSLGTFAGLQVNLDAQVLTQAGQAIPGLYAVGNDMASVMGGHYPAGGITLGPGMTFAFIAAYHASGVPLSNNRNRA